MSFYGTRGIGKRKGRVRRGGAGRRDEITRSRLVVSDMRPCQRGCRVQVLGGGQVPKLLEMDKYKVRNTDECCCRAKRTRSLRACCGGGSVGTRRVLGLAERFLDIVRGVGSCVLRPGCLVLSRGCVFRGSRGCFFYFFPRGRGA